MIGKFKLKQINKETGESTILLEESNQIAQGMKHAMVNILSGKGSRELEDYQFRYFQLGTQNYNLSTFDISADVPAADLKSNMWTIKSPMTPSLYGSDSVIAIVKKNIYGLGSLRPRDSVKFFDNFIDPPDSTKLSLGYTNDFKSAPYRPMPASGNPTTWNPGCANAWEGEEENYFLHPLELSADYTVSGPTFSPPTWSVEYQNDSDVQGITSCVRASTEYIYADGTKPSVWNVGGSNQTYSIYYSTEYYASSLSTSSSTPIGGALQLYNRTAAVLAQVKAGQNRVSFKYRYNLKKSSSDPLAEWYPPQILGSYDGYTACAANSTCLGKWNATYGSDVSGGGVSGNVFCPKGAIYTPADAEGGYVTQTGPGATCYSTPNSGFGPSGNFYRVSVSWNNVPERLQSYDNGVVSGLALQVFNYPLLSSLSGVHSPDSLPGGTTSGHTVHNLTPREQAYMANAQFEYNPSATPYQYIHAEKPYYITSAQDFLVIPKGYVTSLNDNTANVRLLIDENLANNQTIKEVGLFLKNPNGTAGIDNPFLSAYKVISPPLAKNNEFSYIIDWELSLIDSTTT